MKNVDLQSVLARFPGAARVSVSGDVHIAAGKEDVQLIQDDELVVRPVRGRKNLVAQIEAGEDDARQLPASLPFDPKTLPIRSDSRAVLGDALSDVKDADIVRALMSFDDRESAQRVYLARLRELED